MKKFWTILWKVLVGILAIVGLFAIAFVITLKSSYRISSDKDGESYTLRFDKQKYVSLQDRVDLLKAAAPFGVDSSGYVISYVQDSVKAKDIREYFQLDTLYNQGDATWQKALAIGTFVATNIPHDNQKEYPKDVNAIGLWKYTKEVAPAFNCRLHSILTYELLMSVGIINRFVTCMPYDSDDNDCHVVNEVWLPELGKWVMLDTDSGGNYATDKSGELLSLLEMREHYISDRDIVFHPHFNEGTNQKEGYYSYMAKNSYWYVFWASYSYGKEDGGMDGERYILVPEGFEPFGSRTGVVINDARGMWSAPVVEVKTY